jgi:hypothetical protein
MEAIVSVHTVRADYGIAGSAAMALAEASATRCWGPPTDLATCLLQIGEFERRSIIQAGRALFDEASIHGMSNRLLLASSCAQLGGWRVRAMGSGSRRRRGSAASSFARGQNLRGGKSAALLDVEGTRSLAAEGMRLAHLACGDVAAEPRAARGSYSTCPRPSSSTMRSAAAVARVASARGRPVAYAEGGTARPEAGQHTDQVLREHGSSDACNQGLKSAGAVA